MAIAQTKKTHCPQGHPYNLENTYISTKGFRECRICMCLRNRKARLDNPEKKRANTQAWRKLNPSKTYLDTTRRWKQNNPGKIKARDKRFMESHHTYFIDYRKAHPDKINVWREANPEKYKEHSHRSNFKRRQQLANTKSDFTAEEWKAVIALYGGRCAYCYRSDMPLTQDHVIPVSKGGEHTAKNIVPACKSCNSKKGTRTLVKV